MTTCESCQTLSLFAWKKKNLQSISGHKLFHNISDPQACCLKIPLYSFPNQIVMLHCLLIFHKVFS